MARIIKGITQKDIINYDWEYIRKQKLNDMRILAEQAVTFAKLKRGTLKRYLKEKGFHEIPTILRDTTDKSNRLKNKYSALEDFSGYNDYNFQLDSSRLNDLNYLRYKFKMAQTFLKSQTSTIKGFESTLSKTYKTIKERSGNDLKVLDKNSPLSSTIWRLYTQLKRNTSSDWGSLASSVAISYIDNYVYNNSNKSFTELYNDLLSKESEAYVQWLNRHIDEDEQDIFEF